MTSDDAAADPEHRLARLLDHYAGTPAAPDVAAIRRHGRRLDRQRRARRAVVAVTCCAALAGGVVLVATREVAPTVRVVAPPTGDDGTAGTALLDAARTGDHARLADLLASGAPVDHHERYGITALMVAAVRDDPVVARLVIDAGATVSQRDAYGRSALDLAARFAGGDVVTELLEAGAWRELTATTSARPTAAMPAASTGNVAALRALAAGGAVLTTRDAAGRTLHHHALDAPEPAVVVEALLELEVPVPGLDDAAGRRVDDVIEHLVATDPAPGP